MCVVCGCATGTPGALPAQGHEHTHQHPHHHHPVHDTRHGHAHEHPGVNHDHAHDAAPATIGPIVADGQPAVDPATGDLHYGAGSARVSVPGMSQARAIKLETDVLGANQRIADANRAHFDAHGVVAYNLVSSPGSGKTTLLCATIEALKARAPALPVGVIEGDQQTSHDADRIRATGAPAIQVNTGKGCHLDAPMVADAFARLPLHGHAHDVHDAHAGHGHAHAHTHDHEHHHVHTDEPAAGPPQGGRGPLGGRSVGGHAADAAGADMSALLFIENVGNLVCPAMWDLGERAKVAILSVTEGEDKPLKYPDMFAAAQLMVLNKVDLLPHLDFDVAQCIAYAQRVNPGIEVLLVSARTGQGLDAWVDWLLQAEPPAQAAPAPGAEAAELARLRERIEQLEAQLAAKG